MKLTMTEHDFINYTTDHYSSRQNFSYNGKQALFKYLTELEEDTGQEIEFDFIAFCCEFEEYDNYQELLECYDVGNLEHLEERTGYRVIEFKQWTDRNTGELLKEPRTSFLVHCV